MSHKEEDDLFDDLVIAHPAIKFIGVCVVALIVISCVLWVAL
jgi:hypothetical protein